MFPFQKFVHKQKQKFSKWSHLVNVARKLGNVWLRKFVTFQMILLVKCQNTNDLSVRWQCDSKKAHVTHPELKATFCLPIIGVKKNPSSPMFTSLGVITKGTVIEVNISELGLVTQGGKVVWGKYAQVTNNPENDGCINAVLLV